MRKSQVNEFEIGVAKETVSVLNFLKKKFEPIYEDSEGFK
ncbi:MAG: hypothetical protein Ct9H90mP10_10350 [Actinomycetota bacterium]|nr:MAG: hypothetical protein Ct9H90mP10_10350 [Actinomycetota bacterium]